MVDNVISPLIPSQLACCWASSPLLPTSKAFTPADYDSHLHFLRQLAIARSSLGANLQFHKMSSRPVTPSNEAYAANTAVGSRPRSIHSRPNSYIASGTPGGTSALEQGHGPHLDSSPLAQSLDKHEDSYGLSHHDNVSVHDGAYNMTGGEMRRSNSQMSQSQTLMPSRGGTLKKKASLRRTGSLKRSSSKRSSRAGSVRSLVLGEKEKYGEGEEYNSAFYTPVPTVGSPTDILANRFQGSLCVFDLRWEIKHTAIILQEVID